MQQHTSPGRSAGRFALFAYSGSALLTIWLFFFLQWFTPTEDGTSEWLLFFLPALFLSATGTGVRFFELNTVLDRTMLVAARLLPFAPVFIVIWAESFYADRMTFSGWVAGFVIVVAPWGFLFLMAALMSMGWRRARCRVYSNAVAPVIFMIGVFGMSPIDYEKWCWPYHAFQPQLLDMAQRSLEIKRLRGIPKGNYPTSEEIAILRREGLWDTELRFPVIPFSIYAQADRGAVRLYWGSAFGSIDLQTMRITYASD
jgi:hypothetical protein